MRLFELQKEGTIIERTQIGPFPYLKGWRRCRQCDIWIYTKSLTCPRCHKPIRQRPRDSRDAIERAIMRFRRLHR